MRVPVSECELAQKEISIYLLFRRIRYSLIKITKYSPSFSENYRSTNSKENLSNSWIEGKEYEIDHRKLHLCNIKDQLDIKQGYFAEDEENLIILTLDSNKLHWAKIHTNIKLRNVEVIVDRTNPYNLILNAKSKEKYLHKILTFADQNLCLAAKRAIDENRRYFKHYEMSLLLKNFDNIKNDIYESDI